MISISEREFNELSELIKGNYGINLSTKKNLVEGRLSNMLADRGINSFTDYLAFLQQDATKSEITNLVNKITTNHTFFMREKNHFEYFSKVILPYLEHNAQDKDLRIWSAGCSSGEEPYTLAMLIADYFGSRKVLWDTKILATDISIKVLEMAQTGVYAAEAVDALPSSWKMNYLDAMDAERVQIKQELKKEVIFRTFNLMDDSFPFKKKFHTIFCRNVMIYFDARTKRDLVNKFYECTEPGGYLFIGHSESLNREETRYRYIMPAVYRKG